MDAYIWGYGGYGALGLGDDTRDHDEPTLLLDPNTGDKLEFIQIEGGFNFTVGLTKNGEVFTWGNNRYGQLGHGDMGGRRSVPTKVEGLDGLVITKVSFGAMHTAAITVEGKLLTWGWGLHGQLGHGNKESQLTPKNVEALADMVIVDVACGIFQTCAVTSTGSIITWGKGIVTGHGEDIVLLPRLITDLRSKYVVSVSANNNHASCITKDGELFTWGRDGEYGKLGHGNDSDQQTPKRVEALVGIKVTKVSCGYYHTAVCTKDGHMYTFGQGEQGKLGHGDKENRSSPVLVQALVGIHITQVQCGGDYTMALTSTGHVFTCGNTKYGVLGHGNVKLKCFSFPCLVEGLREHNVVQISSGFAIHTAVLVDSTNPSDSRRSQQASFNNQELSDVVFKVDNQSLFSDSKVLTQKSGYFAAMFRSNMKESIERVVQVPNFSKAAFLLVLEYIHLDDFTVSMDDVVELWELADFYQMEGLKYSCMGALERGLSEENASKILKEAEGLSCPCEEIKNMCHKYLEDHTAELKNQRKRQR